MQTKLNSTDKRQKIKLNLIKKYDISEEQAEKILRQFEEKRKLTIINDNKNNNNSNRGNYTNDDLIKQGHTYNQNSNKTLSPQTNILHSYQVSKAQFRPSGNAGYSYSPTHHNDNYPCNCSDRW